MAEAMLAHQAASRGFLADVRSAGLLFEGEPADRFAVQALEAMDLDLTAHRSRVLTAGSVRGADLVLGMARRHAREAAVLAPAAVGRCLTLKEIVRRGAEAGPQAPGQPVEEWLAELTAGRENADLLGSSPEDDIEDPMGASARVFAATAAEIEELTDSLADLLWPPGRSPSPPSERGTHPARSEP